jgi:predicted kinase
MENKKRLVACRWIPASWKSTWTKEQNAFTVNKDEIRQELHDWVWSKKNEKEVVEYERTHVEAYMLVEEELIIVDNTHLGLNNPHIAFYKALAEEHGYEFEVRDFFVTREEAIERDANREKSVWVEVIDRMIKSASNGIYPSHQKYRQSDDSLPSAYIFDIDGTLANMNWWRSPYDYSNVWQDGVNEPVKQLLLDLSFSNDIIIVSWRDDICKTDTEIWLKQNGIPYTEIHMRKTGDVRNDGIVKKELFLEKIEPTYNVIWVVDDRDRVCQMWRMELNLLCLQVYYGNF